TIAALLIARGCAGSAAIGQIPGASYCSITCSCTGIGVRTDRFNYGLQRFVYRATAAQSRPAQQRPPRIGHLAPLRSSPGPPHPVARALSHKRLQETRAGARTDRVTGLKCSPDWKKRPAPEDLLPSCLSEPGQAGEI